MHGDRGPKIATGAPGEMIESSLGPKEPFWSGQIELQKSLSSKTRIGLGQLKFLNIETSVRSMIFLWPSCQAQKSLRQDAFDDSSGV